MAFYSYKEDLENYYWAPYTTTSDHDLVSTSIQTSSQYSSPYEFVEPEMLQYEPPEYHSSYNYYSDHYVNPSQVNFYSEPKLLQYESPSHYARVYMPSETKFRVSYYNTAEFNEPDFEDYDPTPYGGGYDPVATYGGPLPPSDITCYPRSVPQSDSTSLENFSYASIPSPYGKDDDLPINPPNGSKPVDTKARNDENNPPNGSKPVNTKADNVENNPPNGSKPVDIKADGVKNGDKVTSDGGADVGISDEHENESQDGIKGDYGYEIGDYSYGGERQVTPIPYGSGLEAMDICESLFGYWPCLAKRAHEQRSKCGEFCDQERRMDPWESAADYLFGNPLVYDYENHHQQAQYECYEK